MTEASSAATGGVKTLGIQLPDATHAQFSLIASLSGLSLKDAVLEAVDLYIATKREALAEKASEALVEIEKEAALKRASLTALFGTQPDAAEASKPAKPAGKRSPDRVAATDRP